MQATQEIKPRTVYTARLRDYALRVLRSAKEQSDEMVSPYEKAAAMLISEGWNPKTTNRQMFNRFQKQALKDSLPRGRTVNSAFEADVRSQLVVKIFDPEHQEQALHISAAYTHAIVKSIAQEVSRWPQYCSDTNIKRLKFGPSWFQGWKRRSGIVRRRATTSRVTAPNEEAALETMHAITRQLQQQGFKPNEIINADETADYYAQNARYVYLPVGEQRAIVPNLDDSARVTAHITVAADGSTLPAFVILKNASKSPDMSKSRVAASAARLTALAQMTAEEHDTLPVNSVWERSIQVRRKQTLTTEHYRIPYSTLVDGTIVTANPRAWMNTAFAVMWVDLVLRPAITQRGRLALIWDNCGAHTSNPVLEELEDCGITVFMLPPNTTDRYQVCDVVVNGMLKAALRSLRAGLLVSHFRDWRNRYLKQQESISATRRSLSFILCGDEDTEQLDLQQPEAWRPPALTVAQGLHTMCKALGILNDPDKQFALRRTFENLGLCPTHDGKWYKVTKMGKKGAEASSKTSPIMADELLQIPLISTLNEPWTSEEESPHQRIERQSGAAAQWSTAEESSAAGIAHTLTSY